MREPILYRWWDSDGLLLYVGKSISLFARVSAHRAGSAFFGRAATMTIERFDTEEELAQAEMDAIRGEHPIYNVHYKIADTEAPPRTLVVLDSGVEELDRRVGHWVPADISSIDAGDIIRCTWPLDDEIVVMGLVDDDFPEGEHAEDDDGWYVMTDDGSEDLLFRSEAGLYHVDRWVNVLEDDPLRAEILSAYYERSKARVAAWA